MMRYDTLPQFARFIVGSDWFGIVGPDSKRSGVMKLTFLPTLTDLRDMLGDRLYVEFVWMWREQEQASRTQERRTKWADVMPARNTEAWPYPLFSRVEPAEPEPKPVQVALLHPSIQRLLESRKAKESRPAKDTDWLKSLEATGGEPETVASRSRAAARRAAAE
jgi:hypothetical protein